MKISKTDELEISHFIEANPELFQEWKTTSDNEENFYSAATIFALVISFCKNIDEINKGIKNVSELLGKVKKLFGHNASHPQLSKEERVVVIIFDNYVKAKKATAHDKILQYTGLTDPELADILADLESKQIIRKKNQGTGFTKLN